MVISNSECCRELHEHPDLVQQLRENMPAGEILPDLADLFKVFGDSTRIRILYILFEHEVCVCDIASALNMTQSAISHQLSVLKANHLVKSRRDGKSILYSLDDEHVSSMIRMGLEHLME